MKNQQRQRLANDLQRLSNLANMLIVEQPRDEDEAVIYAVFDLLNRHEVDHYTRLWARHT